MPKMNVALLMAAAAAASFTPGTAGHAHVHAGALERSTRALAGSKLRLLGKEFNAKKGEVWA